MLVSHGMRNPSALPAASHRSPPVIEEAHQVWAAAHPGIPAGDRIQLVGGDFFERVPAADVYFLKHVRRVKWWRAGVHGGVEGGRPWRRGRRLTGRALCAALCAARSGLARSALANRASNLSHLP